MACHAQSPRPPKTVPRNGRKTNNEGQGNDKKANDGTDLLEQAQQAGNDRANNACRNLTRLMTGQPRLL